MILCNSLVWSCAITGRAGLTYQEAEECEEKALKQLATFPNYLQRPILYLANQTQRSRLEQFNDDVFVFAKDRFFIGETVEVLLGRARLVSYTEIFFSEENTSCLLFLMKVIDTDRSGGHILKLHI